MSVAPSLISEKQLAANRANALHSTGPRTPEGKAQSSQNARKHLFAASNFGVIQLEDLQEIARLKDDLAATYPPANPQEVFAIERLAIAQQALLRAARLESGLFMACLHRVRVPGHTSNHAASDAETIRQLNCNFRLAEGLHRMSQNSQAWSHFLRFQAQTQRHYRYAVEEFERLRSQQAEKAQQEKAQNEPIFAHQPEQNEHASPGFETKPFVAVGRAQA
jgi:hypothetical protein